MKLCYVAGRYRAKTPWEVECNIQAARRIGAEVVKLGLYPVIPHSNTSHFDGLAADAFWLEGTLELMRRCDVVVLVPGYETSSGTAMEIEEALRLGLPVMTRLADLAACFDDRDQRAELPTQPDAASVEEFSRLLEDDEADRMVGLARGVVG